MITKERSLVIILNRKIVGTAAMGIPEGVYAFVEIHRKFQAVKLNLLTQEVSVFQHRVVFFPIPNTRPWLCFRVLKEL